MPDQLLTIAAEAGVRDAEEAANQARNRRDRARQAAAIAATVLERAESTADDEQRPLYGR